MASQAVLAAVAVALVAPAGARAGGWPRPAAGESLSGDPEVIFTFDDGPHEKWTGRILDTLAAHRVSAIFYWVGHRVDSTRRYVVKRRALVERAVREGHLIGNHTVNHVHLCHSSIDAAAEIDENDSVYRTLTQLPIILFRTPYGDHCRRLMALLGARGLTHLHWDIDPREYNGLTAEGTAQFVIGRLKRLRGRAVVLMHDTKSASAQALPRILDWIDAENARRQGLGRRPIRILSGSDLMAERARDQLWIWGEDAAMSAAGWLERSITSLVPGALAAGAATAEHTSPRSDSTTPTATLASP